MASEWNEGTYVLTVDSYAKPIYKDGDPSKTVHTETYEKGEEVKLDQYEAIRLGESGSIAKPDTVAAKIAQGEVRQEYAPPPGASREELEARIKALQAAAEEKSGGVNQSEAQENAAKSGNKRSGKKE